MKIRHTLMTSCALVLISGAASSEELGLMYNTLTLSGSAGGSYSVPGEPDKLQCKNLIVDGKVELSAKGTAPETVGGTPGTVILVCDSVVFKPGSSLGTWSNLTIRTHDLSGDVVIEGLRKRGGQIGTDHKTVAADGSDGAAGGNGGNGRDASLLGRDAEDGGNGGDGKPGENGKNGLAGGNGEDGEDNVTISVLSDRIEKSTSFDIKTDGGRGGPGGNGQAGGSGGAGGQGGNGGKGGDGSCDHEPNRGGNAGFGGNGGNGGDGGRGGDGGGGGDGGNIYIAKNNNDPSLFQLEKTPSLRAQGGKGGISGQGGGPGFGGKRGTAGSVGVGGRPGTELPSPICFDGPWRYGKPGLPADAGKPGISGENGRPGPDGKDGEIKATVVTETLLPSFITDPLLDQSPSN